MMRFLNLLLVVFATGFMTQMASAQAGSDQELRAGLLDLKNSGQEGSLQVAKMFAQCHGFQLALHERLTRNVILRPEDSDFAVKIGDQAMTDGHMAFLSSVSYADDPKAYVNDISNAARKHWSPILGKTGDIDSLVWEKLSLCQKIAPMSRYYVDEIRRKE